MRVGSSLKLRFQKGDFHLEKGFFLIADTHYGLTEEAIEIIDLHNWKKFVAYPRDPVASIMCEFYANLTSPQQKYVTVRGAKVSFSAATLNSVGV